MKKANCIFWNNPCCPIGCDGIVDNHSSCSVATETYPEDVN